MKKFLTAFLLVSVLTNAAPLSLYANEYNFESGADSKTVFGKSTSSDEIVPVNPETKNKRRNKDASYFPPAYGIFSGEIPADESSLYHNNDTASYGTNANIGSGGSYTSTDGSVNTASDLGLSDFVLPTAVINTTASVTGSTSVLSTSPWKYDDGSIDMTYCRHKSVNLFHNNSLAINFIMRPCT